MELSYMVRGGDGKEYGPVNFDQLSKWVAQGRVPPQQEVKRSDMEHWAPARDFAELQPLFAPAVGTAGPLAAGGVTAGTAATAAQAADPVKYSHMRSGASWFYWIAGLSLINSIAAFAGQSFRFIFGLGITQFLDAAASGMGSSGPLIALVLDLVAAGIFVLLGFFSHKGHRWAFIVGILLFALDTLLLVIALAVAQIWLDVALHVVVLLLLIRGLAACWKLRSV